MLTLSTPRSSLIGRRQAQAQPQQPIGRPALAGSAKLIAPTVSLSSKSRPSVAPTGRTEAAAPGISFPSGAHEHERRRGKLIELTSFVLLLPRRRRGGGSSGGAQKHPEQQQQQRRRPSQPCHGSPRPTGGDWLVRRIRRRRRRRGATAEILLRAVPSSYGTVDSDGSAVGLPRRGNSSSQPDIATCLARGGLTD